MSASRLAARPTFVGWLSQRDFSRPRVTLSSALSKGGVEFFQILHGDLMAAPGEPAKRVLARSSQLSWNGFSLMSLSMPLSPDNGAGRQVFDSVFGILLVGTHPKTGSPFDSLMPRAMLPVAHRPLLSYGLSWLRDEGVVNVAVCGNRETRVLERQLGRQSPPGMTVSYLEDPVPRGAAGSARDAAFANNAETFVIADGTVIPSLKLRDVLSAHHASGACVTVITHSEDRPNGDQLRVPGGIYVFSRRGLEAAPARGFCDIKETLIPRLHSARENIQAYDGGAASPRVLDASTYMAVNEWMIERLVDSAESQNGYRRCGSALVHDDAVVADDATMIGPVLVGPGARIQSDAVIVGPSSLGRDVTIGAGALVSRSIVWRRAIIGERATIDRCVIADDAVIEPSGYAVRGVLRSTGRSARSRHEREERPLGLWKGQTPDLGTRLARFVSGAS